MVDRIEFLNDNNLVAKGESLVLEIPNILKMWCVIHCNSRLRHDFGWMTLADYWILAESYLTRQRGTEYHSGFVMKAIALKHTY